MNLALKQCKRGHERSIENLYVKKSGQTECIPCRKIRASNHYAANREEYIRRSGVRQKNNSDISIKRHGITQEQFDTLLIQQGGVCASCKGDSPQGNYSRFCIDHDHNCCPGKYSCGKCIRGLLCGPCNLVAGAIEHRNYANVLTYLRTYK